MKHLTGVCLIIAMMAICGCQTVSERPPIEKNGKAYGVTKGLFLHQWWDYYERGVSFSDGGFWKEAEADFRQALSMWDTDRIRERTYGMHFIDYFPHRELGVSLYHQKRYVEAITELESSLSSEKSAKAEYFLDDARKAWLESNHLDAGPPVITIAMTDKESLTNKSRIVIHGSVSDDRFVKEIQINGKPVRIDLSAPRITFSEEMPIRPGKNVIVVNASDLTGKTARKQTDVMCDKAGPVLNVDALTAPGKTSGEHILTGYSHDETGIAEIFVDDRPYLRHPMLQTVFNFPAVLKPGQEFATVAAVDLAGNRTEAIIYPSRPGTALPNLDKALYASAGPMRFSTRATPDIRDLVSPGRDKAASLFVASDKASIPDRRVYRKIGKYRELGEYYAMIVGIDAYVKWLQLNTAVNDASALYEILIDRYGFDKENIILRTDGDATRENLVQDMSKIAANLGENDNLLIYFAGHGELDHLTGDGYWIPVNGEKDDPSSWLTNSTILKILDSEKVLAKNILVMADACYSGSLIRGEVGDSSSIETSRLTENDFNRFLASMDLRHIADLQSVSDADLPGMSIEKRNYISRLLELAKKKSRQIVASGGLETVADAGKDDHSLFAYHLLKALGENEFPMIDIERLIITRVWEPVAAGGGQRPVVARFKTSRDQDGQFVLALKTGETDRPKLNVAEKNVEAAGQGGADPASIRAIMAKSENLPDSDPPVVEIKGWSEKRTVFLEQAFLEIHAKDDGIIQRLTVNGQNVLNRPGRNVYVNHLADLKAGENAIIIECVDPFGNKSEKTVTILRKLQNVFEVGSRMAVAMIPFEQTGTETSSVQNTLRGALANSNRFLMKEWRGGMENVPQPMEEILASARKNGVDFVLAGTVESKPASLQITARMVETETAVDVTYQDVYGETGDPDIEKILCDGLAWKLRDELPLAGGSVVKVISDQVITNLGENKGVKKGMHMIFFEEGEPLIDPETGESLGAETEEFGAARIETIKPKMSHSKTFLPDTASKLKTGHKVIMK